MIKELKKSFLVEKLRYSVSKTLSKVITDKKFLELRYKAVFGKNIDFEKIETFNEKITNRIYCDKNPLYIDLADKFLVRKYVEDKIGKKYLVKILKTYRKAEDIRLSELPNKFVLKCNHDSGSVFVVKDKNKIDLKKIMKRLNFYLKRNYYYLSREWQYKGINPIIICEEYLEPKNEELYDIKLHCFKGKVEFIQVASNDHTKNNLYSKDWEKLPVDYVNERFEGIERPKKLKELIDQSEKLSEEFDYVRVDFYIVDDRIVFGEMTFTSNSGIGKINPIDWDLKLGQLWH